MSSTNIARPFFLVLLAFMVVLSTGCQPAENEQSSHTSESDSSEKPVAVAHSARFVFNYPDSDPFEMEHIWEGELSLGDALTSQETVEIKLKEYTGMGRLIAGIGKFENGDEQERYWQFCVNGYFSTEGVDDVMLESGDEINWYFKAYGDDLPCKKVGE